MRHENLMLLLADRLEKEVPDHRFNMYYFGRYDAPVTTIEEYLSCGAPACAAFYACLIPEFRAQGLRLDDCRIPAFEGSNGISAMAEFFAIPESAASWLFGLHHRTAAHEAAILREYVAKRATPLNPLETHQ